MTISVTKHIDTRPDLLELSENITGYGFLTHNVQTKKLLHSELKNYTRTALSSRLEQIDLVHYSSNDIAQIPNPTVNFRRLTAVEARSEQARI